MSLENRHAPFEVGDRAVDRDADEQNRAVVVALPDKTADAVHIDEIDGSPSVAALNPQYPITSAVVTVAYAGELDAALNVWRSADPDALASVCEDHDVRMYDFPIGRLREVDS